MQKCEQQNTTVEKQMLGVKSFSDKRRAYNFLHTEILVADLLPVSASGE